MIRREIAAIAITVAAMGSVTACSDGGRSGPLKVSAASSLKRAFTAYGRRRAPAASFSFAGSDELAAQIRAGGHPDVFAAANTNLPAALFAERLIERPVAFAANRLVLAVSARSRVHDLADLERPGIKLAVGSPNVPVGAYTRTVLARLGARRSRRVLANVRSEEPDVAGVVGKLSQAAVDAGFVYVTDVRATGGVLRAIELPGRVRPRVVYAAAVVRGSRHGRAAREFIAGLLRGTGRRTLRHAGFMPAP